MYALRAGEMGTEPRFPWWSHTSDLNIGTLVANLPVAWCYRGTAGPVSRGWNSSVGSVLGSLSCMVQHCEFDPHLSLW